ncbi:hypothetical protein SLEP1_g58994 [Rubroshorea leprosula]|uniref:CG-1 domain-containing protein n=1 Tax=Rubroshorea leprosula TaxID=152421 RepID=A0AAV5MS85_9ROSI|nr:hypothetical protein SLEP1_g58994 [Rubroshorea leprosula]
MAEARRYVLGNQLDIHQILLEAQQRWLRPSEVSEILRNYQQFHISAEPPNAPRSMIWLGLSFHQRYVL